MIGTVVCWAALTGLSLHHNLGILDAQQHEAALARARMMATVVQTTRLWNAGHGGVYVPVTEATPPNEWLTVPDRDVTIDGRAFTLINPAYMTRQIAELINVREGMSLRLTSRKPIRPANGPDPWEDSALLSFESGQTEILELTTLNDRPTFRYMARMLAEGPCLKCHAAQGYKLGEVRGGLSVSLPAAEFEAVIRPLRQQTVALHVALFLVAAAGSVMYLQRLRQRWTFLETARADQERIVAERTRELRDANAELARSNAELENFAYVASHDLQEPLRMVRSYAQLLEKRYAPAFDAEGMEFLGYLEGGAERMKQMIDDLLAYSRVGRDQTDRSQVSLEETLDIALKNLEGSIRESHALVRKEGPFQTIRGERSLLVRLFQNLVGNALKYHAPGVTPVVTVSCKMAGDFCEIAVADNGIGIPEKDRDRIFLIFQRLHSHGIYSGTGIGLAICRKIVERHGGAIWVEDAPGQGSIFRFTLAVEGPDVAPPQQEAP